MRIKKYLYYLKFAPFALLLLSFVYGFKGDVNKNGKHIGKTVYHLSKSTSGKVGDAFRMNVNNLNIPINNTGVIAEVDPSDGGTTNGYYGNHEFLFSGGFYLSGTKNGTPWANAVASASLEKDYLPGTVDLGQDPRAQLYILDAQNDAPFGQSWQDWKDAVALGADYYNGDGVNGYDPVDRNGNGKWDPDEDAPDQLGDVTAWCVYNDAVPQAQRYWGTSAPIGIEVRQTVFAFASSGAIGNLLFVRYRIKYIGLSANDPESLKDVYFGVWADPDVGETYGFSHNFVGSDTTRNAGYTYLKNPSPGDWGNQPPCFMIDFFSGPAAYIPGVTYVDNNGNGVYDGGDTPLDSAISIRGTLLGSTSIPGARNQPLSSFVEYINGDQVLRDPQNITEARNLMLGNSVTGAEIDPCSWAYGTVTGGVPCADVDPRFWYSGDPTANGGNGYGWINSTEGDVRQMSNTGPFELVKNEEKEIVVAYVVGQGNSPLNSISVTQAIDDGAQFIFDKNFVAPKPPPSVETTRESHFKAESGAGFIDLVWDTAPQFNFVDSTEAYNDHFQGYNIYAYRSNTVAPTVNNEKNRTLIDKYVVDNFIQNVYVITPNGGVDVLYEQPDSTHQLDPQLYKSSDGRLRIRITQDPFTGGPLVKGRPYYFGIQGYALNWYALQFKDDTSQVLGTVGDYLIDPTAFVGNVENVEKIIKADSGGVIMGLDVYNPAFDVISANQVSGYSDGYVGYDIVEPDSLTGDQYEVTFVKDSNSVAYKMFWTMTNVTTNQVIIDSSDIYTYGNPVTAGMVYEGFIPRIKNLTPTFGPASYSPSIHTWYSPFNPVRGTGVYYVGKDIPQGGPIKMLNNASSQSRVIYGNDLRRVELRFGENGKAYRYLNGYIPTSTIIGSKKSSYFYAAGVTASNPDITPALNQDPTLLDDVGQLGQGFVDVPFTAWMVDEKHKETKQLSVAFIEMSSEYGLGKPDGVWDPTDSLYGTSEVIAILNADYDPTGNQVEYTGGNFNGTQAWGDIVRGYTIPDDASGVTAEQRAIAKSPWFNALYVVGLEKDVPSSTYKAGDKLIIPVAVYPYTSQDVYQFTTREGTNLTQDEGKELFKKVNVFPNPLYGFNPATSYTNTPTDNPFVTFSNLPQDVTITIYTLSGNKLRTLTTEDKSSPASSFLAWDLKNDAGVRVASGLYIAIVNSPKYGQKILKFSIIMPQKQLQKY